MQDTVRQHYVPRTYLKHFSVVRGDNNFIHALDITKIEKPAIQVSIENICLEKHIYTLPGATVQERMIIERIYSDVWEKDYDKMYSWLTDPKKINISPVEREFIISTAVTMFYRSPVWNKFYYNFMDQLLERSYEATKRSGHDYFMFENTKISIAGKTVDELKKEHREEAKPMLVLSQLRHALKLISIRTVQDMILISRIADQPGFITSDNPVTCDNVNGGHIMPIDPSNTLSLPLDERHHLCLMPVDEPERRHSIHRTDYEGNLALFSKLALNFGQQKNAEKFILGHDQNLIEFLKDAKRMESSSPDQQTSEIRTMINRFDEKFKVSK